MKEWKHSARPSALANIAWFSAFAFGCASSVVAQSVCIPLPRLLTTMPMGGQVGTQVPITITGQHIDDAAELVFTHPGLTATRQLNEAGQAESNQYIVTIAADCPAGIHEARLMSRLGVSSSRVFSVDTQPEVTRTAANTTLATAMELKLNSICNAAVTSKAVDHYRFQANQGQRIIVHCASRGIDSKLDAVLILADEAGRDLVVERRGGTLDFAVPATGTYTIKVHDLTFNGGPAYFYRLSLRDLPADVAVPQFASTHAVSSFSWPPAELAAQASAEEVEPNNEHTTAQKISLPCDISGSFFPAADVDTFEFTATKGDVWWVEVASERLGRPTDPSIIVQQATGEGSVRTFADVTELSDIASPIKPSSNGYAYDGPPYNGGSTDILGKMEIKQDGIHHLLLSDLFGGTRKDPRNIYRLIIRKAVPDFALAAWGLHMELRNGDRAALSKPIALRGGLTMALEVVVARRDGFDGPIELVMQGLPSGVTAQGLTIPTGKSRGIMLLSADQNAPPGMANASFVGKAQIGGRVLTRACRLAEMAWPVPDSWGEIPSPRLVSGVPVSVSAAELAPLTIGPKDKKVYEVAANEKLTIPLAHIRRNEFSAPMLRLKTFGEGFEHAPQFDVSLAADSSEASFDLAALKTPPGDYVIAFYGAAVAKYQNNPAAVLIAKSAQQKADDTLKAADAELARLVAEAAAAPAEKKPSAEEAVAVAKTKHQTASAAATTAAEKLKAATQQATPTDTVDIVVSEPIAIRVKPAGNK